MKIALRRVSGARSAMVAVAAVLLIALLAAPAMAAPAATSLAASPNLTIVDLGDSPTISAVLTNTGTMLPVGGQTLWLEQAASRGGPWSPLNVVTSEEGPAGLEVYPEATTYYRYVFLGTDDYAAATSNVVTVLIPVGPPPPFVTSLIASPDQSTIFFGDSATISAVLTDTDNALPAGGQDVRVEEATGSDGPWSPTDSVTNDGSSGQYSLDVAPPTGTTYYRFVIDATSAYLTATSNVVAVECVRAPTTLTASPGQATVSFGGSQTIGAVLTRTHGGAPYGGQQVRVEQATSAGGPWSLLQAVTNDATSGACSLSVTPQQTTYYRFVFEGTANYAAATSNVVTVEVVPATTSLTASPGAATVTIGGSQTLSAALMDTSNSLAIGGAQVRVEQATTSGGPWSLLQTVTNGGTTGDYSLAVTPQQTTYYRFVFEGTANYVAATSNVVTVQVASASTSLTASPGEATVTTGGSQTLSAALMDTSNSLAIGGAQVRVEQATSSGGPWSLLQAVTTDATSGACGLAVTPQQTTYYRFVFEGTASYAAVTSNTLTVKVKAALAKPSCPASVKKSKTFKVKGSVRPGAPGGPVVKVQTYRKLHGKWSKYKGAYSTSRSGANYSVKIKIKAAGKFKFKATVATSAKFVGVTSTYSRVLTVKK